LPLFNEILDLGFLQTSDALFPMKVRFLPEKYLVSRISLIATGPFDVNAFRVDEMPRNAQFTATGRLRCDAKMIS
jgi:hypothetical protein